jgi:hypothetical protein
VIFPLVAVVLVGEGVADVGAAVGDGDGEGDGDGDGGPVVGAAVVASAVVGALVAPAGRVGRLGTETVTSWLAIALLSAPPALLAAPHPAARNAAATIPAAGIISPSCRRLDIAIIFWLVGSRVFTRHG